MWLNRILFIFPSVANNPEITKAIAILNGIARKHSWKTDYFDTYVYEKPKATIQARSYSGEYKPVSDINSESKPHHELVIDLQNKIDSFNPNIIAISCGSYEYEYLLTFWPKIKIPDSTITLIGGIHPILKPDEVIESGLFDMVCIGEVEETFNEILTRYDNKGDLRSIENIYFKDKMDGKIIKNPRRKLIDENTLWSFFPDYSLFNEKYFLYPFHGKMYRRFRFEVGRGCPFNCTYCANSALQSAYKGLGKYYRARPLESIKAEMLYLLKRYKIEMFYLDDDCFLYHDNEWLSELFEWYGEKIKKPFLLSTRPETVKEEKIKILKKSGAPFFFVKLGVESGSEKILKDVCNRTTKKEDIINAFEILHNHNIKSGACFMVGLPFETREDIFKSINLCRKIRPNEMLVNIFQPLPGQKLREVCIKEGFIKEDDKLCFVTDGSILKMPQISQEEIKSLRRVFPLYATLPKKYFKKIELCEKDYENNKELYKELVNLRWDLEEKK